jgi:pyruvate/2-oxoglutarate dehydrogenase complex dihydrolipoamide dehydrogenase (E3) component
VEGTRVTYDIAVIGAGSGGLSVAAAAAQFGRKVILFERDKMGGDCLNSGCVPSKALIAKAKNAHIRHTAGDKVDFKQAYADAMAHVHQVIASIAPLDSVERFQSLGVEVVKAEARFQDAHTLLAAGKTYAARRIVIATGSRAAVPPVPGLADVPYLTNETIFDNKVLPKHLIIMGGGPIGIEMAQAHRRLGSEVTVIEAFTALGREDPELASVALAALKAEGVTILNETKVTSVGGKSGKLLVETDRHGRIEGSHLLVAAGRIANLEGLGLEAADVAATAKGVTVDAAMRSSQRHIYAIGDAAGGLQFTHVANYHAGLVIRHALFRLAGKYKPEAMPRVTYCDPEVAATGLSESEARAQHGNAVKVLRWPFHDNDRALTEGRSEGLVKIIAGKRGRILGAGMVGAGAGDLLQAWSLAIGKGLKISDMAQSVIAYPTRGEAGKRAAMTYYQDLPKNSLVRRIIRLINRIS